MGTDQSGTRSPLELLNNEFIIVTSIFLTGFIFYLWILTRHSLIYGIDGPYYLIQVRELLENRSLKYGDPPLAFLLFTLFTMIIGESTLGIKVGVALFSALSAIPFHFWVKKVTGKPYAGYISMLACIFSTPHIRLMNDLLKNTVGAFFMLSFIYYLHNLTFNSHVKRNLALASLFLLLTGATHILDLGVAILFLAIYPTLALITGGNRKQILKNLGALTAILGIFVLTAFTLLPSLFTDFYKGLAFLQDLFTESSETPAISFLFDPRGGGLIIPTLTTGIAISTHEWWKKKRETSTVATVTIIGILLSLPFIPQEWLWRFLLMEFVPTAFIIGYAASKMEKKITIAIFMLLCLSPLILQSVEASKTLRPTIREEDHIELERMSRKIPSNSVVVTTFHIGYWIQYVSRCDISKRPTPDLWQKYDHVLLLFDKFSKRPIHIPKGSIKLFECERFILFEVFMPPKK